MWADIPDERFDNDPPPGDDVDTSPGSTYDRLKKKMEADAKAAEKKRPA